MLVILSAFCFGAALATATEEEACTPLANAPAATGEALLQKDFRSSSIVEVAPSEDAPPRPLSLGHVRSHDRISLEKACYGTAGYHGAPNCLPVQLESVNRDSVTLLSMLTNQKPVGEVAPLDAKGFKQVTALCCPSEMEQFFNRLLEARGYYVCSKPHVQGLMHWFSCVPDMDFQYVIEVIEHGNPCKYWAPKGESCPILSDACSGHYCGTPLDLATTPPDEPAAANEAPSGASTEAPSEAATTTTGKATTTTGKATTTTGKPTTTTPPKCSMSGSADMDFSQAMMVHSNLGGQGPDSGDQNLRVGNAGSWDGDAFDIVVTVPTTYRPHPPRVHQNGLRDDVPGFENFMWIGLQTGRLCSGSLCKFTFKFVHAGTDTPFVLPEVHITVFDIDGKPGTDEELVSSKGYTDYVTDANPNIDERTMPNGFPGFSGTGNPREADNPTDPVNLTPLQRSNSVMYIYKGVSEFPMYFAIKNGDFAGGRFLMFAGRSSLEDVCGA